MKELEEIRDTIDRIDRDILKLLAERFLCTQQVADYKRKIQKPVFDSSREEKIFEQIRKHASDFHIPKDIAEAVFKEIIHQSRRLQQKQIDQK
jgi:monofunctional chorismate mutase